MCKRLKEHAMKIINYEEKEMILLTDEENKSYEEQEACNAYEGKYCADEDDEKYKKRKRLEITVITREITVITQELLIAFAI